MHAASKYNKTGKIQKKVNKNKSKEQKGNKTWNEWYTSGISMVADKGIKYSSSTYSFHPPHLFSTRAENNYIC